ncbi:unnamed protein product, partial [Meganyctiphanes norvegica]
MTTNLASILVLAMVVKPTQAQPEDCRLYQVTGDQPSPTLEVAVNVSDTYISMYLLFDNATASITISDGDNSSCQITVDRRAGILQGNCFQEKEIPLKCSQVGGLNTIVLRRNGHLLVVFMHGDNSDSKVLTLEAPNLEKGIQVQVNSDSAVNTAFNC